MTIQRKLEELKQVVEFTLKVRLEYKQEISNGYIYTIGVKHDKINFVYTREYTVIELEQIDFKALQTFIMIDFINTLNTTYTIR